jgi:hypothetical protein
MSYLKSLSFQTGTTFTFPANGRQASREIQRLLKLRAQRGRYLEASRLDLDPAELPYATEQKPGEIVGYGSSARRGDPPARRATPVAIPARQEESEPVELGRYETKAGEKRGLYGIRVDGKPRIIDAAYEKPGRIYTVQERLREKGGAGELKALVADYIRQAEQLGGIPMAKSRRAG